MRPPFPILAALMIVAGPAPAAAAEAPFFAADTQRVGHVRLYLADVPGTRATFSEQVGARRVALATATVGDQAAVSVPDVLTWSCRRRTRRLVADVVRPDGTVSGSTYTLRTPGCDDRLRLDAPRRAAPGSSPVFVVRDRWRLGDVRPVLCLTAPGGRRSCETLRFAGKPALRVPVRLGRRGVWRIALRLGAIVERRTLAVGRRAVAGQEPATRLLVTGDSSVQGVDTALGDQIGDRTRVLRAFRVGTGISQDAFPWPAIARRQADRFLPHVTVISIGANEGYPMRTPGGTAVRCCGPAWQAEYERRTRQVMTAFVREGRGRVLWLTLPTPRDADRKRLSDVSNAAFRRTAPTVDGVVLIPLDRVLSPGGRFRRAIGYRGRRRVVRAPDGIHLSPGGAAIAGDMVRRALRGPR